MHKRLIRWISPLIILTVIIAAVVVGSIMATTTHAAGVNVPNYSTAQQTQPGHVHSNSYWLP